MSAFATVTRNILLENLFFFLQEFSRSSSFMFTLLLLTVYVQNTICNLTYYFYEKLAKFEQNPMIRTTQNLDLFDKKPGYYINISDISLTPF